MANLLLVDGNGRRRVQMEVMAQVAGHRVYVASSVREALRMAEIYAPEAVLISEKLPDGGVAQIIRALRESGREVLRNALVITSEAGAPTGDSRVLRALNAKPETMLTALEEAGGAQKIL